ncbi:M48 family metallopeptidase [Streptomyces sp. NPDC051976]|uniref:M48 family metallopeptidase n=1 Tax=Streptomyces sp. NPDC051976 TaxID=3154947 RepID=UPI0034401E4C
MAASLRALRALLLLSGFYLLGVGMLALLVGVDIAIVWAFIEGGHAVFLLVKLLLVSLAATLPILEGMFAFRRPKKDDGPAGVRVTRQEQPELWAEIEESARLSGTRPPQVVVLTGVVNAAVSERAHLLGLIRGRRSLYLGVPLLSGLTLPRLRAVLAHEFGHYGNHDTRLAGITMRGRESVLRTADAFREGAQEGSRTQALIGNIYVRYTRMYLRVSQSVSRGQELAADRDAVRVAGRDTTAAALREVRVLDSTFLHYVSEYATLGWKASLLPPAGEFYGGFGRLLAEPGRAEELAALRAELPEEELSPYDSHPPLTDRIRLIAALPADDRPDDPDAPPALSLLRDRVTVLAALEGATLAAPSTPGAERRHLDSWGELAHTVARTALIQTALPLQRAAADAGFGTAGRPANLTGVLAAIDAGQLWTSVAAHLPKSEQAARATGRAAREFLRPSLRSALTALTHLGLADTGRAHWEVDWSGPGAVSFVLPEVANLPDGYAVALAAALDAAVADRPNTGPLRELLAATPAPAPQTAAQATARPAHTADPAPVPDQAAAEALAGEK